MRPSSLSPICTARQLPAHGGRLRGRDLCPAVGGRKEYLDNLHWLKPGFDGVTYVTPFDVVGDFVYNFNEFGQIVITNFADVLNAGKSVEEAMAQAQKQAEAAGHAHLVRRYTRSVLPR